MVAPSRSPGRMSASAGIRTWPCWSAERDRLRALQRAADAVARQPARRRQVDVERHVTAAEARQRERRLGARQHRAPDLHRVAERAAASGAERRDAVVVAAVLRHVAATAQHSGDGPALERDRDAVEERAAACRQHRPFGEERPDPLEHLEQLRHERVDALQRRVEIVRRAQPLERLDARQAQQRCCRDRLRHGDRLVHGAAAAAAALVTDLDQHVDRPRRARRRQLALHPRRRPRPSRPGSRARSPGRAGARPPRTGGRSARPARWRRRPGRRPTRGRPAGATAWRTSSPTPRPRAARGRSAAPSSTCRAAPARARAPRTRPPSRARSRGADRAAAPSPASAGRRGARSSPGGRCRRARARRCRAGGPCSASRGSSCGALQCLVDVPDQVGDVLEADREADHVAGHAARGERLRRPAAGASSRPGGSPASWRRRRSRGARAARRPR